MVPNSNGFLINPLSADSWQGERDNLSSTGQSGWRQIRRTFFPASKNAGLSIINSRADGQSLNFIQISFVTGF